MKTKYLCPFILLLILAVLLYNSIEVKAINTGFETEELSEERIDHFLSYINLSLLETAPEKRGILCFDVNEKEMIAVSQEHGLRKKEICVYSSQGKFLYGFAFRANGSIAVEWDQENLNIYFIRSDVLMSLDKNGNVLDMKAVPITIKNDRYKSTLRYRTMKAVGDTTYQIRNDQGPILNFLTTYLSQIVVTDSDGTERIIYDVNETERSKKALILIIITVIVVHVIAGLTVYTVLHVKYYRKLRKLWSDKG